MLHSKFTSSLVVNLFLVFFAVSASASSVFGGTCGTSLPISLTTTTYSTFHELSTSVTVPSGIIATFDGATVKANGNYSITVLNGGTLIIKNSSSFDVCPGNATWVGIKVNAGGTVLISTNSSIANATIGVDITTAPTTVFDIRKTSFLNNGTGINVKTWNGAHLGVIDGNNFASPTGTGIRIAGVVLPGTLKLNFPIIRNTFQNVSTGISITNSVDITVTLNTFSTIGVDAINAVNTTTNLAKLDFSKNNFTNCASTAVFLRGKFNHTNTGNNYLLLPAGSIAIKMTTLNGGKSIVFGNTFNKYSDGILVTNFTSNPIDIAGNTFTENPAKTSIKCTGNTSSDLTIIANNLDNFATNEGVTAIVLSNAVGLPTNGIIFVVSNTIKNYEKGISCTNFGVKTTTQSSNTIEWNASITSVPHIGIQNITCTDLSTAQNVVDIKLTTAPVPLYTCFLYKDCNKLSVTCNTAKNTGGVTIPNYIGFDFNRSVATSFTVCSVQNNEDFKSKFGFRFINTVPPATTPVPIIFMGNRMESESSAGLRLQGWGIGTQGSLGLSSWNRWHTSGISIVGGALPSTFYTKTGLPPEKATPTSGCTFPSGASTSFSSPCLPPIVYKTSATNSTDLSEFAEQGFVYSAVENIPASDIKATTDLTVSFYPNPATDRATYEIELADNQIGSVQIFDLSGRQLSQKDLIGGYNKVEFDLTEMPNGMYIYKVNSDKITLKTGKFVVQK